MFHKRFGKETMCHAQENDDDAPSAQEQETRTKVAARQERYRNRSAGSIKRHVSCGDGAGFCLGTLVDELQLVPSRSKTT
jgi:hypothetical protein